MDGGTRPFIGRRYELDRVRRAIDSGTRLVVVEGDSGMGKTRLLRESVTALPGDFVRFEGAAEPYDARLLGPIRDAFAPHVAQWERVPDTLRRHQAAIDALFPNEGGTVRDAPPAAALADSIVAILQHSAGAGRALLIIDDLQWADSDVLTVLSRIVRGSMPCTTVVATRTLEREEDYLIDFVVDLQRSSEAEHLELVPLTVDEVSDLLRRTVGLSATTFALDVHERTGGHPFLIRQLLDTGQLNSTADTFDLPRTVTESTRRTLLRLSDDGRLVVQAAATLDRSSTFAELARFTEFDESRLLAALQELCDERLLTEPSSDEFAFAHVLAQQAVNESIVSRQRRRLHARALDVLPADADPLEVVRHADQAGTPERALAAVRSSARRALDSGHSGLAYRLAAAGTTMAPDDDALKQILALSAWHTGRRSEARRIARELLENTPPPDTRTTVLMEWLIARVAVGSGAMDELDASLASLIALLDVVPDDERTDVLMRLAEITMIASRVDGVDWGERALASTQPGTIARAEAMINLGSALTDVPARREEGRRMLRAAVESTRNAGSDLLRARALNNLLSEAVYVDNADEVTAMLDEFEAHLLATGLASHLGDNAVLWRGVLAERGGDLAAARAAVSWFGPAEPERTSCLVWFKAMLEVSAGDLVACKRELDREPPARPDYHSRFEMVDLERAARCGERTLDEAIADLFELHAPRRRYMLEHIDQVGRLAVVIARMATERGTGHPDLIAERWRSLMALDPDGESIQQHLDGIAAEGAGRHRDAIERYDRSLAGLPRRAATIAADAHQGVARCWDVCNDRRAARQWATSALTLLEHWPGPDRDAATRLLRSLGGRPHRTDATNALSDREREVAELVGRGLTNKQIGASLFISDRTVGVHIQHIMTKLGLGKRAEIATYVARRAVG